MNVNIHYFCSNFYVTNVFESKLWYTFTPFSKSNALFQALLISFDRVISISNITFFSSVIGKLEVSIFSFRNRIRIGVESN